MRHSRSRGALVPAAALLLAALGPAHPPASALEPCQATDGGDPRPHCCFTHPRYVGVCEIEPQEDETCASIHEYLNNPQSQGKAYCDRTSLRGGWKQVPCQPL